MALPLHWMGSETARYRAEQDHPATGEGAQLRRKIADLRRWIEPNSARLPAKGGKAAHQKGTAHEWTSEEARDAGRKGGLASHKRRREQMLGSGPESSGSHRGRRHGRPRRRDGRSAIRAVNGRIAIVADELEKFRAGEGRLRSFTF